MERPILTTRDKMLSVGLIAAGVAVFFGPFHPPYWNIFSGAAIGAGIGAPFHKKLIGAALGVPVVLALQLGLVYLFWK